MLKQGPIANKITFLGPCSSGKTSIINRFHEGEFCVNADPTVGADFVTKDMMTSSGEVSLYIWNTAGQDESMDSCSRGTTAIMECLPG
jgi:Rab family protein